MFEQQIEETISSIKRRTIGDNSSITLKAVMAADIPAAVKTYFNLDVKQWIKEEHDRLLNSPHFDYTNDDVRRKFRDIEQLSRPMIRFTEEEFDAVLDQAVKLHFNYMCRPEWTLSKFVFGEKDVVSNDAITDALEYFVQYDYFKLIIGEYLATKNYTSMHRDRFEELVATIDGEVTKGFDSRKMAQIAQPIFDLFSGERETSIIPIEALSVFYDDKNISPIVERLDAEKDNMPMLSMHDLTVLISEVDFSTSVDISNLVIRHLYPEKQAAAREVPRELTDEELTRSIIRESREASQKEAAMTVPREEYSSGGQVAAHAGGFGMPEDEEEEPLTDFQIGEQPEDELPELPMEDDLPLEEQGLPNFDEDEAALPDYQIEESPEKPQYEEEIPRFHHVPEPEDAPEVESSVNFSFTEEEESLAETPAEAYTDLNRAPDEESEEALPRTEEFEDEEPIGGFGEFSIMPGEEENEESAASLPDDDELEMPEEFEGFKLAPDEESDTEDEPPAGEHEVPEFSEFSLDSEEALLPSFGGDLGENEDHEKPVFDDFLPVSEDTTTDRAMPAQERFQETGAEDDDDFNLDFSLGDETEMIQDKEPVSFDSFLSGLDDDKPPQGNVENDFSFLEDVEDTGPVQGMGDLSITTEEPTHTPGGDFSFEGEFTPPESDITFETKDKLLADDQINEYSAEDETHFTEFEFEPPDDDSLILPELDLSLDENEAEGIAGDTGAGGFDFSEALAAEATAESRQDDMQDLMKDFARDQSQASDSDDTIGTLGDLKQAIPVKDKKLYIKSLFNKDEDAFEAALNELNRKRTWRDASEYIDELFIEHDVDMYSKIAIKFTDEIYKRYMPKG